MIAKNDKKKVGWVKKHLSCDKGCQGESWVEKSSTTSQQGGQWVGGAPGEGGGLW